MKKGVDYIGVGVGAMIFDDQGRLFLTKRGPACRNEIGHWEIPGGGLEFGEKMIDGIKREMMEELAIEIEIIEQLPATDHIIPHENQHWVPTTFIAKIIDGQIPVIKEKEKCDEIGFFHLDNLPQPLSIVTRLDLEYYNNRISKK